MKTRYVVFVSSTYTDLVEERQAVSKALLRSDCFPSQMENWPAMDAEQMEAIRQLIDECDYYLVVSAGKYGSIDPATGKSYTELEYDYARSIGKPMIRLLHKDPFRYLRGELIEDAPGLRTQLEAFRTKLRTGSVCSFWTTPEELQVETILALQDLKARHPQDGWVRADISQSQVESVELKLMKDMLKNVQGDTADIPKAIMDVPIALLTISEDGSITSANQIALDYLNLETAVGSKLDDLFEALGRRTEDWLEEVFAGTARHPSEYMRVKREDKDSFVEITLRTVNSRSGKCVLAALRDVTDLKTLEAMFIQSQKATGKNKAIRSIAKDFRNLLMVISGHCDFLLETQPIGSQEHEDLQRIHQSAKRANSLISELTQDPQNTSSRPEHLNLYDTFVSLRPRFKRFLSHNVEIKYNVLPDLPEVWIAKDRFELAIANLITNANEAMPSGGTIKIHGQRQTLQAPIGKNQIVIPAGNYVRVTVEDWGHGIPADKLDNIFYAFYSSRETGNGVPPGLGLSTTQDIVTKAGGYIFASSVLGQGSVFTILFPDKGPIRGEETPHSVLAAPQEPGLRFGTVLLAESDPDVRAFIKRSLIKAGYTVMDAENGEAALDLSRNPNTNFDAFVSAVVFPTQSGSSWLVTALQARPETPVVIVSEVPQNQCRDLLQTLPFAIFLEKPVSSSEIVDTVSNAIDSQSRKNML